VNYQLVGATAPNEFTFTDFDLSGNQRYYYRVVAKDAVGVSIPSSAVSVTTRAAAATNLKIYSASPTQLMIEWKDSNGESSYKVQRSADGISGWTTVGSRQRTHRCSSTAA
jgi:titin